jgi:hypothetical protein
LAQALPLLSPQLARNNECGKKHKSAKERQCFDMHDPEALHKHIAPALLRKSAHALFLGMSTGARAAQLALPLALWGHLVNTVQAPDIRDLDSKQKLFEAGLRLSSDRLLALLCAQLGVAAVTVKRTDKVFTALLCAVADNFGWAPITKGTRTELFTDPNQAQKLEDWIKASRVRQEEVQALAEQLVQRVAQPQPTASATLEAESDEEAFSPAQAMARTADAKVVRPPKVVEPKEAEKNGGAGTETAEKNGGAGTETAEKNGDVEPKEAEKNGDVEPKEAEKRSDTDAAAKKAGEKSAEDAAAAVAAEKRGADGAAAAAAAAVLAAATAAVELKKRPENAAAAAQSKKNADDVAGKVGKADDAVGTILLEGKRWHYGGELDGGAERAQGLRGGCRHQGEWHAVVSWLVGEGEALGYVVTQRCHSGCRPLWDKAFCGAVGGGRRSL